METVWPYLGDLHRVLRSQPVLLNIFLIAASILCGTIIGLEREVKEKPAGLRTVSLISVGSTIFSLISVSLGDSRIAAQIVTGIGFLGAGAIIREQGTVVGLTTGATIWTIAAIGVAVGYGYAAAGVALSLVVLGTLTVVGRLERRFLDCCKFAHCRVLYQPDRGKTRIMLLRILDHHHLPTGNWDVSREAGLEVMDIRYCYTHREHRSFIYELVDVPGVVEFQPAPGAQQTTGGAG